jgi:octaprenyl-diphosphate synthase
MPSENHAALNPAPTVATLQNAAAMGRDNRAFEMHVDALRTFLGGDLDWVESELPSTLAGSLEPLVATGVHLLEAGGKRVRPILTLLCAGAVGVSGPAVRKLACAGELVHLATLLHDDVIDDADTRRNRPTPRVVWSNTASVLGGDYALTRALDLVAEVGNTHPLMEAVQTLRELVEGEVLQLEHRGRLTLTLDAYNDIIYRKTASLFRWCCRSGAWLGDAEHVETLGRFGVSLGLCFQVVDDVLDVSASETDTGKAQFTDLRDGKLTLPLLLALESEPDARRLLVDAVGNAATDPERIAAIVLPLLARTDALARARQQALAHADDALTALASLPDGAHVVALRGIAQALANRMR